MTRLVVAPEEHMAIEMVTGLDQTQSISSEERPK